MLLFTGTTRNSCACKQITKTTNSRRFFCKIFKAHRDYSWILRNAYLTAYYQSVLYAVGTLLANLALFRNYVTRFQNSYISVTQMKQVFEFIKQSVSNRLEFEYFCSVSYYSSEKPRGEYSGTDRISFIVTCSFFVKPNHKKEKNIKTGISEGANHYKKC